MSMEEEILSDRLIGACLGLIETLGTLGALTFALGILVPMVGGYISPGIQITVALLGVSGVLYLAGMGLAVIAAFQASALNNEEAVDLVAYGWQAGFSAIFVSFSIGIPMLLHEYGMTLLAFLLFLLSMGVLFYLNTKAKTQSANS